MAMRLNADPKAKALFYGAGFETYRSLQEIPKKTPMYDLLVIMAGGECPVATSLLNSMSYSGWVVEV